MYNIVFSKKVESSIKSYTDTYREYFEKLYEDSWIWSHKKIVDWYKSEALNRYIEIMDIIESTLSHSIVSYSKNETIIKWRSRILLISFSDLWDIRTINSLEIR